jgi:hypothetical protein
MTLDAIQTEIVARITAARIGSALRFALMDAADALSRAIEAEAREAAANPTPKEPTA